MTPTETAVSELPELEAIKQRCEKATPFIEGQTVLMRYGHGGGRLYIADGGDMRNLIADFYEENDREFYFNARTDIPKLLTEIERRRKLAELWGKERGELEARLEVAEKLDTTFWDALKLLNLPAIRVENPGSHVVDLIKERDTLAAELASAKAELARVKDGYPAWLVENGKKQGEGLAYLRMGPLGVFDWTEKPHAALHFCRRADAEAISAECEDAWRIVEHWFATKMP